MSSPWWVPWVGWCLTVLAMVVREFWNRKSVQRAEEIATVRRTQDLLSAIAEDALVYWQTSVADASPGAGLVLASKLYDLDSALHELNLRFGQRYLRASELSRHLREKATGGTFETKQRKPVTHQELDEIQKLKANLQDCLSQALVGSKVSAHAFLLDE